MKKNRMMRLASILLVCVLLSTSVISGTFAKYTTTASAGDTARVAKWGITMNSTGSETFADTYEDTVATSATGDAVVAPGTKGSAKYYVYGKPETDYVVTFTGTTGSDIFLGAGNYSYVDGHGKVTYSNSMNANVAETYYPMEWKVTITTDGTLADDEEWASGKTFATAKEAMEALAAVSIEFDANAECDVFVDIAWEWDFDNTEAKKGDIIDATCISNDAYDTILGDMAARVAGAAVDLVVEDGAEASSLTVSYKVVMTATQVD